MKVERNGQAKIFSQEQLQELWPVLPDKYCLIFRIAYYTAGRIGEVAQLQVKDISDNEIIFRAKNTKTNQTREVRIPNYLREEITIHCQEENITQGYLFTSTSDRGYISNQAIDKVLRKALDYLGWQGYSTHSFRRSLLTHYYNAVGSLTKTRQISRHSSLASLERYLDCSRQEAMDSLETLW